MAVERPWLVLAITSLFGVNGLRNTQSHFVGPPFPTFKAHFQLCQVGISPRALTESSLIGGCGYSHCLGWLKLPLGADSSPIA